MHHLCLARLRGWLFGALLLVSPALLGEPYQARDESLQTFFTALSLPLGQPIVVSPAAARKRISGVFEFGAAQPLLEATALQQDLIWYSDGQVLYLYDASEAKSSVVALRHISVERLRGFMRRAGLDVTRHPLHENGVRMFSVSGPPKYVDRVMQLAQMMDRPRADLRLGQQTIGVVQVLNSHVADREYMMGEQMVMAPGLASIIKKLLASAPKSPGLVVGENISVLAYADINSLLIKGKPEHVRFVEQLVAELDVPRRALEVSLWLLDVDRVELKKMFAGADGEIPLPGASRVLEPSDDQALMKRIAALERRRLAKVSALPVILGQENVPAVFRDDQTVYLPPPGEDPDEWQPVVYGTQVSVLPRFVEGNQVEMQLRIEDGRPLTADRRAAAVANVGIETVLRVPQGRRLLVGNFQRGGDGAAAGRYLGTLARSARLFVIEVRAVGDEQPAAVGQPPPLTRSQHETVKRAFMREPP